METKNVYKDLWNGKDRLNNYEYPKDSKYFDKTYKRVIGKFEDEVAGIPVTEFTTIRSVQLRKRQKQRRQNSKRNQKECNEKRYQTH